MKLTHEDAMEVGHKLGVLADTPDLQADYGLTKEQADTLRDSVPPTGGEWTIPAFGVEAVRGEIADHVEVLRDIASDARSGGEMGQALRIAKQAARFERWLDAQKNL
jgi:hypothetical protein